MRVRRSPSILHWIEWLSVRLVFASLAETPLPVAKTLARVYGKLIYLGARRARRVALRNLEMAGLPDRERIARGVFDSIGRALVSLARLPQMNSQNLADWIRPEGLENFETERSRGRGVLIAAAHLGNWELLGFATGLVVGPIHIVARPLNNPLLDELVERYRSLSGNHIHWKRGAVRDILRALESGEVVALLIDFNTIPLEGAFIDFFGVKACASTAVARLARQCGAAVVPAYAVWSEAEQRYVAYIEPEVEMTGDVAADTQRINARFEAAIRKFPDQWLWTHKRWKTRPPGEPALY